MAKNRNNKAKNSKNSSTKNADRTRTQNSVKNTHAEVPDDSPGRSGPGGQ